MMMRHILSVVSFLMFVILFCVIEDYSPIIVVICPAIEIQNQRMGSEYKSADCSVGGKAMISESASSRTSCCGMTPSITSQQVSEYLQIPGLPSLIAARKTMFVRAQLCCSFQVFMPLHMTESACWLCRRVYPGAGDSWDPTQLGPHRIRWENAICQG